jgi:hypothetical protein
MKKLANKKTPNNDNTKNVVKLKGYALSKHNATKHGVFSKNTVMEWESKEDYDSLVDCLVKEYQPKQITEQYLVEEIASIMWRKNRLKYAEKASLQSALNSKVNFSFILDGNKCANDALLLEEGRVMDSEVKSALTTSQSATNLEIKLLEKHIENCNKVIDVINATNSYKKSFAVLSVELQEKWEKDWEHSDGDISESTAEGLASWLEEKKEKYERSKYLLENNDKIKAQVIGSTLIPDGYTDQFIRCENHLDRKFEKTLSMLVKLQELRSTKDVNLAKSVL